MMGFVWFVRAACCLCDVLPSSLVRGLLHNHSTIF